MSKEVKELHWSRLPEPYNKTGLIMYWWQNETYELRADAMREKKYTGPYECYDKNLQDIFADLNKLLTKDHGFLKTKALYDGILVKLNSFSKTKGYEGCPIVVDQKNTYQVKFAKEFAERIPKIHQVASEAVKKDTKMNWMAKKFVNSILSDSTTLTTLLANAEKTKASLPKDSETPSTSFTS